MLPRLDSGLPGMAELDRRGWADGLVFDAHTARLGVRVSDAGWLPRVRALLPPGAREMHDDAPVQGLFSLWGPSERAPDLEPPVLELYSTADCVARSADGEAVLAALQDRLHFAVALHARARVFVHAGVVGWRGRAIVLPGRSHAGKSSLVAALVRAGATYYSDEYAVIDPEGWLHAYPKAIALRSSPGRRGTLTPVESLGGRAGEAPLRVGLVVSTRYREGAAWRPRELSPALAILSLLDNTVVARLRPALAMDALRAATAEAVALEGERGDAHDAALAILAHAGWTEPAGGA